MRTKTLLLALIVALCVTGGAAWADWDLAVDSLATVQASYPVIPMAHGQWSHGFAASLDPGWTFTSHDLGTYGPGDGLARWESNISLTGGALNECPMQLVNTASVNKYGLFDSHKFYVHGGDGTAEHPLYNIVRWTAPASDLYKVIVGLGPAASNPGGVNCQVLVNEVSQFSQDYSASGEPLSYEQTFAVPEGGTIDLAVSGGGAAWTNVDEKIQVVTDPTLGLVQGLVTTYLTAPSECTVPVKGAQIEAKDSTGTTVTTGTAANGRYAIALAPGTYTLKASIPDRSLLPETYEVVVVAGGTATQDYCLDPHLSMTFYVKPDGDDNKDGLSRANAWKTIQKANEIVIARDIVKVAPGTYEQTDYLGVHITAGGAATGVVTFMKDDGAGPGNPVIDMSSAPLSADGANAGIVIDADHIKLDGFEIKNALSWGILVANTTAEGVGHRNIEIANCTIHGIRAPKPNFSIVADASGLMVCAGINSTYIEETIIRNNLIYDVGDPTLSNTAACIAVPASKSLKIHNNTLAGAQSGLTTWVGNEAIEFKNNIVTGMRGHGIDPSCASMEDAGEFAHANNFYFANAADFGWPNPVWGAGEFNCNPNLAADYTLQAGSAAINAGVDVGLPFQGSAPDLGAFESSLTSAANAILQGTVTANVTGHPAITRAAITAGGVTLGSSDLQGKYKIPVVAGTYSLTASRKGFVTSLPASVTVGASGTATRDFDLSKGTGTTWYVNANSGDDSRDGDTPSTAWATINRGDIKGVVGPGDTVMVAAGTYPQTSPLGVRLANCCGEVAAPINYKASGGAVVISQTGVYADDYTSSAFQIDLDNVVLCRADADSFFDISSCQYGVVVRAARAGNTVADCIVHDIIQPVPAGSGASVYLAHAAAILCSGATDTTVRNNAAYNIGDPGYTYDPVAAFMVDGGSGTSIVNNAADVTTIGAYVTGGATGVSFRNNILSYFSNSGIYSSVPAAELVHSNNLFFRGGGVAPLCTGLARVGVLEFEADPLFVAPFSDYRLLPGSPAANMGVNVGLPFSGPAPDLGAYESTATGYPSEFGVIKGTVRYRADGMPVEGANVSILEMAGSSCATGSDGAYGLIVDPGVGTCTVQAIKAGFAPREAAVTVVGGSVVSHDFYLSPGTGAVSSIRSDWSLLSNPSGNWGYGEADSVDSASFAALLGFDDHSDDPVPYPGLQIWTHWLDAPANTEGYPLVVCNTSTEQQNIFPPDATGIHPGQSPDAGSDYGIVRWTALTAGTCEVNIEFGGPWNSPTTDCHVVLTAADGTQWRLFDASLDGSGTYTLPYAGRFLCTGGETIDAFVGNGGNGYGNDWTPLSFEVITTDLTPVDVASVAAARAYADGKLVNFVTDEIVTVGSNTLVDGTACYIEDQGRTSGIKVVMGSGGPAVAKGKKVRFQGYMGTDDNGERFITITPGTYTVTGTGSVRALGMTNKAFDARSVGVLVRVWGTVTETNPTERSLIIDDGSGIPVKVFLNAGITTSPAVGKTVGITGPAGLVANGPVLTTVVRARDNNDVKVYN